MIKKILIMRMKENKELEIENKEMEEEVMNKEK